MECPQHWWKAETGICPIHNFVQTTQSTYLASSMMCMINITCVLSMTVWLWGNRGQMFSLSPGRRTCWMCNVQVVLDDILSVSVCDFICFFLRSMRFYICDISKLSKETSISWWCKIISHICPKALQRFCALMYMVCIMCSPSNSPNVGWQKKCSLLRKLWCLHDSWRVWLCQYQQLFPLMSMLRSLFSSLDWFRQYAPYATSSN